MPSCFPVFFNSKKRNEDNNSYKNSKSGKHKRDRALSNLTDSPSCSASTLSNDSILNTTTVPNSLTKSNSNNNAQANGNHVHTHTRDVITIREYVPNPLKSEPQMMLPDRDQVDRLNSELKLAESEAKSAQLKLKIALEKNKELLNKQEQDKKLLTKKDQALKDAQKRIEDLLEREKSIEDVNHQVKSQFKEANLDPEVEALLTGLAYALKEAYAEIEEYKVKEHDLLIIANETGEEIRRLQIKQKDTNMLANECGQELCDTKYNLELALSYINQLKKENENSEKIIVGLVNEIKSANKDYDDVEKERQDLTVVANETGEEIVKLRTINKDQNTLINEVGQEFFEAKYEIDKLRKENKVLCLLLNGIGQEFASSKDRIADLEKNENDLLLFANETGEEIYGLQQKIKDQLLFMNEAGDELVNAKAELVQNKQLNSQYLLIIEGLAKMLNSTNDRVKKLENENQDLMNFANETGEEIIMLRQKINDSKVLINEVCNELICSKDLAQHYKKYAFLYVDMIEVLIEKLDSMEKENASLVDEKEDLLFMANETGEEIIDMRLKLKDSNVLINECTNELIEEKAKNQNIQFESVVQKQIIEGLTKMLKDSNEELEKAKKNNSDMELLANEAGQEIYDLREFKKDANLMMNETGNEICELKMQLENARNMVLKFENTMQ